MVGVSSRSTPDPGRSVSVLELEDVQVEYVRRGRIPVRAVAGASVSVTPGEIVGLVGESGCGKSTLAHAAVGLVAATGGKIRFGGIPVEPLTRRARSPHLLPLQIVFQDPFLSLNPRRRVGSQLADGLTVRDRNGSNRKHVAELLEMVGLSNAAADRYPHQFSGGQRQRLAIARALAGNPSILVLDEPLSALDASAQAQIANLLVDLSQRLNIGMLLISHDLAIVREMATRISVMYLGVIVEEGPAEEVWSSPQHPYTQALIGAVPQADGLGQLPNALAGEVPDPSRPPSGCRFHPRCPHAFSVCFDRTPTIRHSSASRRVACWLYESADAETGADNPLRISIRDRVRSGPTFDGTGGTPK
jgi:oligopeptide/dipeptide ABC transporter ATP-binding protein